MRRASMLACAALGTVSVASTGTAFGAVLSVPADHASIQAALDAAAPGDTVRVAPGRYVGNVSLRPGVRLESTAGAADTILDAEQNGDVVHCASGAALAGFTVTGSGSSSYGVRCVGTDTLVERNIITGNDYDVACHFGCTAIFRSNVVADAYDGFGIWESAPILTNNTIVGISWVALRVMQRSVATVHGNIIVEAGYAGIYCESGGTVRSRHNDVWNNGTVYGGAVNYEGCGGPALPGPGDLSVDPEFVERASGDFRLRPTSAAIEAGANDATGLGAFDFDGYLRIFDGDADGAATADMGAFEYSSSLPAGRCAFGLVGPDGPTAQQAAAYAGFAETCNGEDDDCDGVVDDGNPGGGGGCDTGRPGECAAGRSVCAGGALACVQEAPAATACIDPSASVSPGANVGEAVLIGAGAVVAFGAQLAEGVRVGAGARIGRDARLGPGAALGVGAQVQAGAVVGAGATLGDGATVASAAFLGADAQLGAGSVLGVRSVLGAGARVETRVVFGRDVTAGARFAAGTGSTVAANSHFADDVTLGADVRIGSAVNTRHRVALADGARVGNNVSMGSDVTAGALARIDAYTVIGSRVSLGASVRVVSPRVPNDTVVPDGAIY